MSAGRHAPASAAALIVVPPNDAAYADPAVMTRLEAYLHERFPSVPITVLWVEQPRVATFTVVCHGPGAGGADARSQRQLVLAALAAFEPAASGSRPN